MNVLNLDKLISLTYAVGLILLGYLLAKKISHFLENGQRFSRHQMVLLSRVVFYFIFTIFFIAGLQQLGFNLSVLLGAAGVFTVAISFASQTAASNLISGIFLLFEHPFKMGDQISVKGVVGTVESIDLLSTKIKTADNTLVRIPNEGLIKSDITNLSYFPTRRLDLPISIAFDNDLSAIKQLLLDIAHHHEKVLKTPPCTISIAHFSGSVIELILMLWVKSTDLSGVKNDIQEQIKRQFMVNQVSLAPTAFATPTSLNIIKNQI